MFVCAASSTSWISEGCQPAKDEPVRTNKALRNNRFKNQVQELSFKNQEERQESSFAALAGAAPKNIDRPRVKGAFHRLVEQSKAGQD
jgi:hypothetical protein